MKICALFCKRKSLHKNKVYIRKSLHKNKDGWAKKVHTEFENVIL